VESDALIKTMLNAVDAENSRATMETDRCVAEFDSFRPVFPRKKAVI
jgi:hypothetical protein